MSGLFDLALADGRSDPGGQPGQGRLDAEALAHIALLGLEFNYLGQEGEVAGPSRDLLVVQVLLGDGHLFFEELFILPFLLSPAGIDFKVRENGSNGTYFSGLSIAL